MKVLLLNVFLAAIVLVSCAPLEESSVIQTQSTTEATKNAPTDSIESSELSLVHPALLDPVPVVYSLDEKSLQRIQRQDSYTKQVLNQFGNGLTIFGAGNGVVTAVAPNPVTAVVAGVSTGLGLGLQFIGSQIS